VKLAFDLYDLPRRSLAEAGIVSLVENEEVPQK